MKPTVSVVMAAYNGARLIGETLESLSRQTMTDWEAIVVDDASTDATPDIVAHWPDARVRLVVLSANGGPVRARNRALAQARGRYIAALDQDDLCHPDRFARQVRYLDETPATALVATAAQVMTGDGARRPVAHPQVTSPALVGWMLGLGNPLVWSSVMLRAEAARALDPFTRPDLLYAEDFDLYHRMAPFGAVARIDAPLVTYRSHAGGASQRYEARMLASATLVLAEAHRGVFGVDAAASAALIVSHLMHGVPVPGAEALAWLARVIDRHTRAYLERVQPDAIDRHLIERERDRRWKQVVRAALRAGTIGIGDAAGAMGRGHLAWARVVGQVRRARRRQIFAA
jgi:hypothetical protein